jgi:hypothetical protein
MSKVQAVLFDNTKFTSREARQWLDKHKFMRKKKVHKTANKLRYRIREPGGGEYRTKKIADGIQLVIEFKK